METLQITTSISPDAVLTAPRRSKRQLERDASRAAQKRKRGDEKDENDDHDDDELSEPPELSDAENGVDSATDEDEPALKPKKKSSKKPSKAKRPRKPATKRVKTNGTLAGTVQLVSRPKEHRIQAKVDPDRLFGMHPLATHPPPSCRVFSILIILLRQTNYFISTSRQ